MTEALETGFVCRDVRDKLSFPSLVLHDLLRCHRLLHLLKSPHAGLSLEGLIGLYASRYLCLQQSYFCGVRSDRRPPSRSLKFATDL